MKNHGKLKNLLKIKNKLIFMTDLTTPITDNDLKPLQVGDKITISGTIYTGRDAALPQLVELIKKDEVPFDLTGSVIMHTSFSEAGIAPTTSSKEEIESTMEPLSKAGVKIHIGKGMLSDKTVESLDKHGSIFVITPPVAALLTSKVLEKKCVLFENEGMEAMYELKVENIPGIVAIQDKKRI
jgi:fumarate hydratase subunit beta